MTAPNPLRPKPGTPRPYHFPEFTHRTMANGLTLWIVPIAGRDLVSVSLLLDAGASAESEADAGLASLTAQTLVTGTRRLDGHAFAEATERLGIEMMAESSWDSARAGFGALASRLDEGMALLAEMILEPRFDGGEFERLREERLADILQARSEPGRLAEEWFLRACFAEGSPYGRLSAGVPETVEPLTVEQARAHHDTHWRPDRAHLVVAGPVNADAVASLAETTLGAWTGTSPGHRDISVTDGGARRVVVVDRPGSVQSELRVGHVGIERGHPDYFAAIVMAAVLGGTFSARLNQRLREELGYTYGARAAFDPRRAPGPFAARAAVQTDVTADAVRETLALLDGMRSAPPDDDELREVTDYLVGVFPLRFETTAGAAAGMEPIAVYGLDHDWWATYRSRIEAVTPTQVHQAALDLVHPAEARIVMTADAEKVGPSLEAAGLGPIEVVVPDED